MATATSPAPDERNNKRMKGEESSSANGGGGENHPGAPPPPYPQGPPQSQPPPPGMPPHQPRYPPHYAGHPPPPHMQGPPPGPYHYGGPPPPHGQYGNPPPPPHHPHHWQGGMPPGPPPPPGQGSHPYPPSAQRGLSPERPGPWGYRGSPPPHKSSRKMRRPEKEEEPQYWHGQPHGPPPPYHTGPPPQPYGGPPPPGWQGGHPPPPTSYSSGPPPMYGSWTGKTPPRRHRDPYAPRHDIEMPHYMSRGPQHPHDDDGANSSAGGSTKDKGRGSYKCGRCGVPKKGHVCPYQPKLKRRPDEPPPDTRTAAVQVEMDEFMTLRRLNIRIQGFPESYATEPYMNDSMVVGEPAPMASTSAPSPMEMSRSNMMHEAEERMTGDSINDERVPLTSSSPSRDAAVGDGNLIDPPPEAATV